MFITLPIYLLKPKPLNAQETDENVLVCSGAYMELT